jgi:hypothetical protein
MTTFGLQTVSYSTSSRTWLASDHGTEIMPGVPLDLTGFNSAQMYPNGYIASGVVLGKVTSSGKYVPYLDSLTNGTQTAVGIMFNDVQVYVPGTTTLQTNVTVPILLHGFVYSGNLPYTSSNAALGGYLDANAQTDLKNIVFWSTAP